MDKNEDRLLARIGMIDSRIHQAKKASKTLQGAAAHFEEGAASQIPTLTAKIEKAGVGKDEESEKKYCRLLMGRHRMQQSQALSAQDGQRFPDVAERLEKGRRNSGQTSFDFDEEAHPRAAAGATDPKYKPGEFVPKPTGGARQLKGWKVADHTVDMVNHLAGEQQQQRRGTAGWRQLSGLIDMVYQDPDGFDTWLAHSELPLAVDARRFLQIETEEKPGFSRKRMLSMPLTEDDLETIKSGLDYIMEEVGKSANNKYVPEQANLAKQNLARLRAVPYKKWTKPAQAEAWLLKQDPQDPIVEDVLDNVEGDTRIHLAEFLIPDGTAPMDPAEAATEDPRADWREHGVRSAAFKNWFGDWEHDPEHSSKVVNPETGEPADTWELRQAKLAGGRTAKPVYHGSGKGGFSQFDFSKTNPNGLVGPGFYFTENEDIAKQYLEKEQPEKTLNRELTGEDIRTVRALMEEMREDTMTPASLDSVLRATEAPVATNESPETMKFFTSWLAHRDYGYPFEQIYEKLGLKSVKAGAPTLYQCYLNIRKPWDGDKRLSKDDLAEIWKNWPADHEDKQTFADRAPSWVENAAGKNTVRLFGHHFDGDSTDMQVNTRAAFVKALQNMGYDGLTHVGGTYAGRGDVKHRVWVAWDATQVKSGGADAEGTFDPTNPDIRKAVKKRPVPTGQGAFNFDEEAHPRASAGASGKYKGGQFTPHRWGPTPHQHTELRAIRARLGELGPEVDKVREAAQALGGGPHQDLYDKDPEAYHAAYREWSAAVKPFSDREKELHAETHQIQARVRELQEPNLPPAAVQTGTEADEYQRLGARAPAFLHWFGDWEHDPANASKVVKASDGQPAENYNITPVSVYHGTAYGGYTSFDPNKDSGENIMGKGFYFTEAKNIAEAYSEKDSDDLDTAAGRATGVTDAAGNPVTHLNKKQVDAHLQDPTKNNPNWTRSLQAAAEVAAEPGGYNVEKFLAAVHNPDLVVPDHWGQNPAPQGRVYKDGGPGLRRLFYDLKVKPVVPPGEVFEVYLNIRNPFDMDEDMTQDELDEFVDYVNDRNDAYHSFSIHADDLMTSEDWDKLSKERWSGNIPTRPTIDDIRAIKRAIYDAKKQEYDDGNQRYFPTDKPLHGIFHLSGKDRLTKGDVHYILTDGHHWSFEKNRFREWMHERGNDGIHHTGGFNIGTENHSVWIAFHPSQIKATSNQGTFDPANPDINKALKLLVRLE